MSQIKNEPHHPTLHLQTSVCFSSPTFIAARTGRMISSVNITSLSSAEKQNQVLLVFKKNSRKNFYFGMHLPLGMSYIGNSIKFLVKYFTVQSHGVASDYQTKCLFILDAVHTQLSFLFIK